MLLAEQLVYQRYVHPGPLVLGTALLKSPTPTTDRDRTVSRRSEPSSRTALMGPDTYTGGTTLSNLRQIHLQSNTPKIQFCPERPVPKFV